MTNRKMVVVKDGERTDHYSYLAAVRHAKLLKEEKLLLLHYANTHNWKEGRCSFWSEQSICAAVSMSNKTFRKYRDSLVDLGWIVVHSNGDRMSPDIELRYGKHNPKYETKEWAKWWKPEGEGRVPFIAGNPSRSESFSEGVNSEDQEDKQLWASSSNEMETVREYHAA